MIPLVLLAAGCMMPDQLQTLQTDVAQIRAQMETLRKENQTAATELESVKAAVEGRDQGDRERAAESKRQLDAIRDELRQVNSRLDEMQHRLSGLASAALGSGARPPPPAAPPKPDPVLEAPASPPAGSPAPAGPAVAAPAAAPPPRAAGTSASADDAFNAAYADYSKGNYTPAILGFEDYLKRYPESEKADDALYWIGLCHYDQGEYPEAITAFDRLIQEHPDGDKVPGAHLKKGLSLLEMNRTAQGVVQLQYVIEKFPRTEEARISRDRLKELGVKP